MQNKPWFWGVAVTATLLACYSAYRWLLVADIQVASVPSDAVVYLDGRRIGKTPLTADLPTGVHQLQVKHSYYQVYKERLDITAGERLQRTLVLQPGTGLLRLLSNPKNAWVDIDGVRQEGLTPIDVRLTGGPHEVLMGQSERKTAGTIVEVVADQVTEVNLELNMDPHGTLNISTRPKSATITLEGTDLGYQQGMRLPIGEYGLLVKAPGYVPDKSRFFVRYGSNQKIVELRREYGVLEVNVKPKGADVRVTYQQRGTSQEMAYTKGMRIPSGAFEIRARAMLFRTQTKSLTMTGAGQQVDLTLTPMNVQVGTSFRDNLARGGQGPELVVLPAGSFVMGDANGAPSEQPAHRVTITQPFAVGRYEVTVGEFLAFAQDSQHLVHMKLERSDPQRPMHLVSWQDANDYVDWLSKQTGERYRLPSEARWEYAARAGSSARYYFGNAISDICKHANLADLSAGKLYRDWQVVGCNDGFGRLAPVGQLQPNGFGLYDVAGNVSEWVAECGLPSYRQAPNDGSTAKGGNCTSHGHRGGSWDSSPEELQSAYRNSASSANQDRGFRVVREM